MVSNAINNLDLNPKIPSTDSQNVKVNNIFAPDGNSVHEIGSNLKQQYSKYEELNKEHEGQLNKVKMHFFKLTKMTVLLKEL